MRQLADQMFAVCDCVLLRCSLLWCLVRKGDSEEWRQPYVQAGSAPPELHPLQTLSAEELLQLSSFVWLYKRWSATHWHEQTLQQLQQTQLRRSVTRLHTAPRAPRLTSSLHACLCAVCQSDAAAGMDPSEHVRVDEPLRLCGAAACSRTAGRRQRHASLSQGHARTEGSHEKTATRPLPAHAGCHNS